jgi:hypothetical protein
MANDFNGNLHGPDCNSWEMNGTHPNDIDGWERRLCRGHGFY